MAVDIRCVVSCSLGTPISGSINDEYVQGTGLIKYSGSLVINDVITPAIGTAVTVSYTKGGVTRQIPRKLRVLSSFADPFRGTTAVELGCKLTYLQDLRERINWTAFDDPGNTLTEADAEIITLPIAAASVAGKCLVELGITSSGLGLSNYFSIASFDLSAGYVSVLSDLLVSESRCGYLDANEVLQVFSLDQKGGTGPVFDATQLVDISKIGMGQLPGEAVTVSYSTLKLKGEVQQTRPEQWERQINTSTYRVPISYTTPGTSIGATKTYSVLETDETLTSYFELLKPDGETLRLVQQRVKTYTSGTPKEIGKILSDYLSAGLPAPYVSVSKTTTETYEYDEQGNETRCTILEEGALPFAAGALSVPFTFPDGSYVSLNFSTRVQLEKRVTETITVGNVQQITETIYRPWWSSQNGQQTVAAGSNSITTAAASSSYINAAVKAELSLAESTVRTSATIKPVSVPTTAEVNNQAAANGGNANNGYRVESTSQLALAVGSASAQRRIELSMPHAPDDRFYKVGSTYGSYPSDAPQKAAQYGRVQNRLLLGNRNGMNVQLAPELMPTAPFAPFMLQAKGVTALYRTNGTSWTFDAQGMVVSTDALFWGGVGGTFASRWFPVAPGITTLPTTPAVVDGQMTVSTVVPTANETVITDARLRIGCSVQAYPFALAALTEVPALTTRLMFEAARIRKVEVPTAAATIAAVAPGVASGGSAVVAAAAIGIAAPVPTILSGAGVSVPVAAVELAALEPYQVGRQRTEVKAPPADVGIAALPPAVVSGASIAAPAADTTLAGAVPVAGAYDPSFSSVGLLLHMDGTNNSTTFTDNSSNAFTATVYGNAKISTAQSKFSGASGLFDGNGDYIRYSDNAVFQFGTGAFTIEAWLYIASLANIYPAFLGSGVGSWGAGAVYFSAYGNNNPVPADRQKIAFGTYTSNYMLKSTTSVATGQWYHVAVTRTGTTVRLFINGTLEATATNSESINLSASGLVIGACGWSTGTDTFNGYIDDLRITKGVARYTASFTAPTVVFPNR